MFIGALANLLLSTRPSRIWRTLRKSGGVHTLSLRFIYSDFFLRAELARAPACIIILKQLYAHLFHFPTFPLPRWRGASLWFGRSYDDDEDDDNRRRRRRRLTFVRLENEDRGNMNA